MSPLDPVRKEAQKQYWRSLDELADTPRFRRFVENEFPAFADAMLAPTSRRNFLKVMGASMALAGMTACRWPREEILPFTRRPEGYVPGDTLHFATAMDFNGAALGLLVASADGRPIKVEGNPDHPQSLGGTLAWHQAATLSLYDPERSANPVRYDQDGGVATSTWNDFDAWARDHFAALRGNGRRLRVLSEASSSPSLADMRRRFLQAFPQARWHEFEPATHDNRREGLRRIFGRPLRAQLRFDRAEVVISLGDDFLITHPSAVRNARDLITGRDPEGDRFGRLYVLEAAHTVTGSTADYRVPMRAGDLPAAAGCLAAWLFGPGGLTLPAGAEGLRRALDGFRDHPLAKKVDFSLGGKDLLAHRGASVVTAGEGQPPAVHALVAAINQALGNVGNTVVYTEDPDPERPHHVDSLRDLTRAMNAGEVDTLVVLGGNPVFDAPADLGFAAAYSKVPNRLHLSLYRDETTLASTWHLPRTHFLEAWGDGRAWDGTVAVVQPLIAPLFNGRSALELIALTLGGGPQAGYDIVRRTLGDRLGAGDFETAWRRALHDGVVAGSAAAAVAAAATSFDWAGDIPTAPADDVPEIVFLTSGGLFDGRFANNGWLIEMPDPMTKLTWDNAALMAPKTARDLGVRQGDLVNVSSGGHTVSLPVYEMPGQARGTVAVQLGFGRTAAGSVGNGAGFDVYPLRTATGMGFARATVEAAGGRYTLATTQDHFAIDALGAEQTAERSAFLVQEISLADWRHDPRHALDHGEHPEAQVLESPLDYAGHKWGMAIDLNACTGCNTCVIACQAENNIPVVGKDEIDRGREMHWLRVDRYFSGRPDDPSIIHQPMPCQQCENAPCEQVCPVAATVHDHEGLNVMVYNRCIGTRYCSNNCPFKVRRFNYFNNHKHEDAVKVMVYNPEVTVRSRGVMEKCTYCLQRISKVKIEAKNARRSIEDGEIVPACAQACPTRAITFGDLNDANSRVRTAHDSPRTYGLLEVLNVKPRTRYMARVRNANPDGAGHDQNAGADSSHAGSA